MRQGVEAPQGAVQPPCRPVPARQQGQDRRRQRAHTLDLGRREDGSGRAIIETNPPAMTGQRRHARHRSGLVPITSGQLLPNELEHGSLTRHPRI